MGTLLPRCTENDLMEMSEASYEATPANSSAITLRLGGDLCYVYIVGGLLMQTASACADARPI